MWSPRNLCVCRGLLASHEWVHLSYGFGRNLGQILFAFFFFNILCFCISRFHYPAPVLLWFLFYFSRLCWFAFFPIKHLWFIIKYPNLLVDKFQVFFCILNLILWQDDMTLFYFWGNETGLLSCSVTSFTIKTHSHDSQAHIVVGR